MEIKSKLLSALVEDKRINNGTDKKIKIIIYHSWDCDLDLESADIWVIGKYEGISYQYRTEPFLIYATHDQTPNDPVHGIFFDMFPADDDKDFKDVRRDGFHVTLNNIDAFVDFLEVLKTDPLIPYSEF